MGSELTFERFSLEGNAKAIMLSVVEILTVTVKISD